MRDFRHEKELNQGKGDAMDSNSHLMAAERKNLRGGK
jgi:hypothetical protein